MRSIFYIIIIAAIMEFSTVFATAEELGAADSGFIFGNNTQVAALTMGELEMAETEGQLISLTFLLGKNGQLVTIPIDVFGIVTAPSPLFLPSLGTVGGVLGSLIGNVFEELEEIVGGFLGGVLSLVNTLLLI